MYLTLLNKGMLLNGGGSSGGSTTVTVPAIMTEPEVVKFGPADESALPNDVQLGGPVTYSGPSFTDREKFYARWAFSQISNPPVNLRHVMHVTINGNPPAGGGSAPQHIYVFTGMEKPNSEFEIVKIATDPSAALPDAAALTTINNRLQGYGITITGFGSNEAKAVKMALNKLTNDELDRMRDVRVVRAGSGGDRVGGHYVQASHTIEMFDTAFDNGLLFCEGTASANLLPKAAHAVLHESAHVLAYWEIRQAELRDQQARQDLSNARATMRNNWSAHYHENVGADGSFSYTADPESAIQPPSDRPRYRSDLNALDTAMADAQSANQAYSNMTESQMMTRFTRDSRGLAAVTPYSRDEAAAATDDDTRRVAREEFLAEAFSIHRWDSPWLGTNRSAVKTYFDRNRHLLP